MGLEPDPDSKTGYDNSAARTERSPGSRNDELVYDEGGSGHFFVFALDIATGIADLIPKRGVVAKVLSIQGAPSSSSYFRRLYPGRTRCPLSWSGGVCKWCPLNVR